MATPANDALRALLLDGSPRGEVDAVLMFHGKNHVTDDNICIALQVRCSFGPSPARIDVRQQASGLYAETAIAGLESVAEMPIVELRRNIGNRCTWQLIQADGRPLCVRPVEFRTTV